MNSAKQEMLERLARIVQGLQEQGHPEEAQRLSAALRYLRSRLPRDSTIPTVLVRTLQAVVANEATVDGRMIDALGHLAVVNSASLVQQPVLLIVAAIGGHGNPDRTDAEKSNTLDMLLSVILETERDYSTALYTLACLARKHDLNATADAALKLLDDLHAAGTVERQSAQVIQTLATRPQPTGELGWVVQLLLTLASLAAIAAVAGKIAEPLRELVSALDDILGEQ